MATKDTYRSLSNIFTPKVFRCAVFEDDYEPIVSRLKKHKNDIGLNDSFSIQEGIKEVYKILSKNYPNEYYYKSTIFNKFILGKYSPRTASFFCEIRLGGSIADILIINGIGQVYEIKTELDSPKRLSEQINNYSKVIPLVNVIVYEGELGKYEKNVPEHCGITIRTKRNSLRQVKAASEYYDDISGTEVFKCFRKPEYLKIVKDVLPDFKNIPNTKIYSTCLSIFLSFSKERQLQELYKTLKNRKKEFSENSEFLESSKEFNYMIYTNELKSSQLSKFHKVLAEKIS